MNFFTSDHQMIQQVVAVKTGDTTIREEQTGQEKEVSADFLGHFPLQTKFIIEIADREKFISIRAQVPGSEISTDVTNLFFETEIKDSVYWIFTKKDKNIIIVRVLTPEGWKEEPMERPRWSRDTLLVWFYDRYPVNTKMEGYMAEGDMTRLVINGQNITGEAYNAVRSSGRSLSLPSFSGGEIRTGWVPGLIFLVLAFVFGFLQW